MNVQSQRNLRLLELLESESGISQRTLASRLGIALGLTNLCLKRLIRKGYIKCVGIKSNRITYLVTPAGVAEKTRLTYEFIKHSLDLYRDARRRVRQQLQGRVDGRRVAIYGTGEAAELAYILLREIGVEPVAIFDDEPGATFLGYRVGGAEAVWTLNYDLLIVAVLDRPARTRKRLERIGVPASRILLLRECPDSPLVAPGLPPAAGEGL
ncbi:MAG: winged helix-turn-helix transcriptional regulator [Acidobacteriota bacterium]